MILHETRREQVNERGGTLAARRGNVRSGRGRSTRGWRRRESNPPATGASIVANSRESDAEAATRDDARQRKVSASGATGLVTAADVDATRMPGTGRSSSADAAANAITARTCSADTVGKSATISSMLAPSARLASTVRRGTLVPRMIGCPPRISGRRS